MKFRDLVTHGAFALIYMIAGWGVWHLYLEDDSAVWVNTKPPILESTDMPAHRHGRIVTLWHGFYRIDCNHVLWHYTVIDSLGAVVWTGYSKAERNTASAEIQSWPFHLPFPPLAPGNYLYRLEEVARCNPLKRWVNEQTTFSVKVA
jgi:hypothetical protein